MNVVKKVLAKIEDVLAKGLKKIVSLIKKISKVKVKGISILLILLGIICVLGVGCLLVSFVGKDRASYPIVYTNSDGDLVLYKTNVKNEDDAVVLSNNDSSDNIKYSNNSDKYVLFKKSGALHIYKTKSKDDTTIKIINDVYLYNFTDDDKYVIALDNSKNLYSYNISKEDEAYKLDDNVSSLVEYNNKYVLYVSNNNLYIKLIRGNDKDEKIRVSSSLNIDRVLQSTISKDNKKVYYINSDNELMEYNIKKDKEEKIANDVVSFNINEKANKMYYQINDNNTLYYYDGKTHKIDEDIYRIYQYDVDKGMVLYSKLDDGIYELYYCKGSSDAVLVQGKLNMLYDARIFKDDAIYYIVKDNELKYATISGDKVKKSKSVLDNIERGSLKEFKNGMYVVSDNSDNGGKLYKINAYKAKKIDEDVNISNLVVGRDGKKLYYFKDYSDKSGSFYMYNGSKSKLIDSDVYTYSYVDNDLIYYIKDYNNSTLSGDLYRYKGKSTKIASDVKKIFGIYYTYVNK